MYEGIYWLNSKSVPTSSLAEGFPTPSSAVMVRRQGSLQAQMQNCASTSLCWSSSLLCQNKAVLWVTHTSTNRPASKSNQYLCSDPLQLTLVSIFWNSFISTIIPIFTHIFQAHAPIPVMSAGEKRVLMSFLHFVHTGFEDFIQL